MADNTYHEHILSITGTPNGSEVGLEELVPESQPAPSAERQVILTLMEECDDDSDNQLPPAIIISPPPGKCFPPLSKYPYELQGKGMTFHYY